MVTQLIDLHQIDARCLDLWNGSSNNLPPTNWDQLGFNDSGWVASANPALISESTFRGTGSVWDVQPPFTVNGPATLPVGGPEPVWPTASVRNVAQAALFRAHVTLPDPSIFTFDTGSDVNQSIGTRVWAGYPGSSTFNRMTINGTSFGGGWEGASNSSIHPYFVAGDNLFAWIWGDQTALIVPSTANLWSLSAWNTFRISLTLIATPKSSVQIIGV